MSDDVQIGDFQRVHQRLDRLLELVQTMETRQAVSIADQRRCEEDIKLITAKLAGHNAEIDRYRGDRKVVMALLALFVAFQGTAVKILSGYYEDLNNRIKDGIFESTRAMTEVNNLRDKIMHLHSGEMKK